MKIGQVGNDRFGNLGNPKWQFLKTNENEKNRFENETSQNEK